MLDKTYQPAEIEPRIHAEWEEAQAFRAGRPDRKDGAALLHRHPAAQRDGLAAHGACAEQHAAGRALPLRAHARQGRALAAGHRSRRHRDADGGRAPADGAAGAEPARAGAREVRREGVGVEGGERLGDPQPVEAPRRLVRLEPRALHHGRGSVEGRAQGVRRSLQRQAHLQGQAARQLGPEVPDRDLRPRGRAGRGEGHVQLDRGRSREAVRREGAGESARPRSVRAHVPLPLSAQREGAGLRQGLHRRRDDAARDDAGRHRRRRAPER